MKTMPQCPSQLMCYYLTRNHARFPRAVQQWLSDSNLPQMTVTDDETSREIAATLSPGAIQSKLITDSLGQIILYQPEMESTQKLLYDTYSSSCVPSGTLCVADVQRNGKGRGSNLWSSPAGCLTFSFQSEFKNGQQLAFVQYLVSLALIQVTQKYCPDQVRIKWPNDLYCSSGPSSDISVPSTKNIKIGGILCQSDYQQGVFRVTTGVGINVSNPLPTTCINSLIEKTQPGSALISRETFLTDFCNVYEKMERQFQKEGFYPFEDQYQHYWLHSDQHVKIQDEFGNRTQTATIKGLTPSGCLLALDAHGQRYELYPDGNSFDFFSGLLHKKI